MIKSNLVFLLLAFCLGAWCQQRPHRLTAGEWPEYGGTLAGQRYSNATEISRQSVKQLKTAWVFHTHTFDQISSTNDARSVFESTPVLWQGTLYFTSPYNEVFAIDASSGSLRWKFDPQVNRDAVFGVVASRGVALWHSNLPVSGECHDVVLLATLDRRLIARDARTGESCRQFGVQGTVDLTKGVQLDDPKYMGFTSPPVIVGQTIVLGSSVTDNQKYFAGSGAVRGFDVRSGKQMWSWEPLRETQGRGGTRIGSANAWAPLAADPEHDLVFVPTSSPSLDYFGGNRIGDDRDADSIVALRASTGQKVWAFQLAPQLVGLRHRISAPAIRVP